MLAGDETLPIPLLDVSEGDLLLPVADGALAEALRRWIADDDERVARFGNCP